MLMHARTWVERLRFSVVDLLKLPFVTLLHRPGNSGQFSLTRSWRLPIDGFTGARPHHTTPAATITSPAVQVTLFHPQATSPAPSTHLRPRMPRHAAAHCSYTLPVTLPSPLAGHGAPSAKAHTMIRAAIDIYFLSCACSCSLMLVAMLVCGAGARNVCCMRM